MILNNDIIKADATEPAPEAGGKPQGGPNSAPREDHKYISRKWKGGKWEYEYKTEAHPQRHGFVGVHLNKEHTLDLPPGVGKDTHAEPEAYNLAVRHMLTQKGPDGKGPAIHPGFHPKTKEPVNFRIASPPVYGPNGEMLQKPRIVMEKRDVAARQQGRHSGASGPKNKYGETLEDMRSYQKFEKFQSDDEDTAIKDESGNKVAEIKQVRHHNPEKGSKNKYEKIKIKLDPKHFGFPGEEMTVFRSNPESAKKLVATLQRNKARLAASASRPSVSAQMASGASATQIVASGSAPVVPGEKLGLVKLKFDSPEEEQAFVNKLASENIVHLSNSMNYLQRKIETTPKYLALYNKVASSDERPGKPGEFDPAKLDEMYGDAGIHAGRQMMKVNPNAVYNANINPGSAAYAGLLRAASTFDPANMKDPSKIGSFIAGGATTAAIGQLFGEKKAGQLLRAGAKESLGGSVAAPTFTDKEGKTIEVASSTTSDEEDAIIANIDASRGAEDSSEDDSENEADDEEDNDYANTVLKPWKDKQLSQLRQWASGPNGSALAGMLPNLEEAMGSTNPNQYAVGLTKLADHLYKDPKVNAEFKNKVIHHLGKSLQDLYTATEIFDEYNLAKSAFISAVDAYDHMEGSEDHPVFYYKDSVGNYKRYTNAPEGHKDYSKLCPKPMPHYTEPAFETNPEFFTQGGQKLTRAPFPNCQVQWNPNYHENDPENLWVGRWVNPVTGQHEFTYLEKDIINQPKLKINRQNAITDARLTVFRNYVHKLFHSPQVKDHVTGLALMLMDQGRMKPSEIAALGPSDVEISGDLIRLDDRVIHADTKVQMAIASLVMRSAEGPLFDIPKASAEGKFNPAYIRRIGPHYLINICMEFGIAPVALQTYQATQIYSQEVQKLLTVDNATLQVAHHFALLEVAQKMGYNMDLEPNVGMALEIIQNTLIDPVVFEAIMKNAIKLKVDQGQTQLGKTAYTAVPYVNSDLVDKTSSEKEFSDWLHNYPMHTHAEPVNLVTKSISYTGKENFMDFCEIPLVLEHNAGEMKNGKELNYDYGYVDFPIDEDHGEAVNVFVGPSESPEFVYIAKKNNKDTYEYDEDKVMLGWDSEEDAKKAFLEFYQDPNILGGMSKLSLEKFKTEIKNYRPSKTIIG